MRDNQQQAHGTAEQFNKAKFVWLGNKYPYLWLRQGDGSAMARYYWLG